jgi:hypothetical protein
MIDRVPNSASRGAGRRATAPMAGKANMKAALAMSPFFTPLFALARLLNA